MRAAWAVAACVLAVHGTAAVQGTAVVQGMTVAAAPSFAGLQVLPPEPVPPLTLTDQHGRLFAFHSQRGRVVLMTFGYTLCTDVCPATLALFARTRALLGARADLVRFVFITVDPSRDTSGRLRAYMAHFHDDFLGLTGSGTSLARAYAAFGVVPERYTSATGSTASRVTHPPAAYLIDRAGYLRLSYAWGVAALDLAADIRLLLDRR